MIISASFEAIVWIIVGGNFFFVFVFFFHCLLIENSSTVWLAYSRIQCVNSKASILNAALNIKTKSTFLQTVFYIFIFFFLDVYHGIVLPSTVEIKSKMKKSWRKCKRKKCSHTQLRKQTNILRNCISLWKLLWLRWWKIAPSTNI